MLQHLHVKDIALIQEITIDFDDRLNILTGETGAGKSILIGSINIALGQRSTKDLIRKGADRGLVELLFCVESPMIKKIESLGIECDGQVLISRIIMSSGRSYSKINGQTVTNQMLKQLASLLIDIHGQHEHQSLLDEQKHIQLLDMFCKKQLEPHLTRLDSYLSTYSRLKKELDKLQMSDKEKERTMSILEYEINEIQSAELKVNEENELLKLRKKKVNQKRLYDGCQEVYERLKGDFNTDKDVLNSVNTCLKILKELTEYDNSLEQSYENVDKISIWLDDTSSHIRDYIEHIDHDEGNLIEIESRLDLIQKMRRKYGESIEDILEYKTKASMRFQKLQKIHDEIIKIEEQIESVKQKILEECKALSKIRRTTAKTIEVRVEEVLKSLEFEHAKFIISIAKASNFTRTGFDEVQFLISTNVGEDVKPLNHIASGGEMSRIMLALKSILAEIDEIPTLIFDEIDTGISGRTAQRVAEKLVVLSNYRQVVCITHLPQIAAMADEHLLIEKNSDGAKTITNVRQLGKEERQKELARLISGVAITETTMHNAKEIIELADQVKKINKNERA